MRILITTGIFKPDVGGPATLGFELAKRLAATGHTVMVITYSEKAEYAFDKDFNFGPIIRVVRGKNKLAKFFKYFEYFFTVLKHVGDYSVIYSLEWFSAGFLTMLAARFRGKKYAVRVSGGYIWEKYLSQGNKPISLVDFMLENCTGGIL
jgi:hypothetical protein